MTYVVPEELKRMLDLDARKEHSANGAVLASLARILERHEEMVRDQVRREADAQGTAPSIDVPRLRRDLENARLRLAYARRALIDDGYFTEDEVSDDIAPRIGELCSHLRGRLDQALPGALREALDQLRAQVARLPQDPADQARAEDGHLIGLPPPLPGVLLSDPGSATSEGADA